MMPRNIMSKGVKKYFDFGCVRAQRTGTYKCGQGRFTQEYGLQRNKPAVNHQPFSLSVSLGVVGRFFNSRHVKTANELHIS